MFYTAIAQQPVSALVDANSTAWQFYGSGILTMDTAKTVCPNDEPNHAVTIVGYNYDQWLFFWKQNYAIVKNSFGTDWGQAGYMKINTDAMNGNGTCLLYTNVLYPNV
mmetsp:Transcript_25708/g.29584  ORF Transcript_25708/g.29584 Transcript_25708/m.29584 type:complete len:108 (+) Transcript_25708:836-1159(+)